MQNFEALYVPHPDAAERFHAFALLTIPRLAPRAHLANMNDELLRDVYARTRVAEPPHVLRVNAARFDHDEVLRLAGDARIVISTNLGHEGKHPASRLTLRVWLDQEVLFSLPLPRNDGDEDGFVSLTGPRSAHDPRQLIVRCAFTGPERRVNLWVGQFTVGAPACLEDFMVTRVAYGEDVSIASLRNLGGTSVRVTCGPSLFPSPAALH